MRKFSISKAVDHLLDETYRTLKRFPSVLFVSTLAAARAIYAVQAKTNENRVLWCQLLGIPLFLALTLFRESRGWRRPVHLALELIGGCIFIAAIYFYTNPFGNVAFLLRYVPLSAAVHLLVAFIATPGSGETSGFWQLNKSIFLRILFSIVYAGVFFVGLAIALVTIEKLFDSDFGHEPYLHLWIFSTLVFQTWHFLAGLPTDLRTLRTDRSYPSGLRVFVQYLLIPIVSLYMMILYAYMAKILMTAQWPNGYVGWLVSAMSVLGIFNLLLIDPEKNRPDSGWIRHYSRAYYALILPLIAMYFVAVWMRINTYGVTEPRYYLVVLGILLTALALYFLFSRTKDIKIVPISLFLVAVLSLAGPWSAVKISERSQVARATEILERNGLIAGIGEKRTDTKIPDGRELVEIFNYLAERHGVRAFEGLFPKSVLDPLSERLPSNEYDRRMIITQELLTHLGIANNEESKSHSSGRYYSVQLDSVETFPIEDYSRALIYQRINPMPEISWNGKKIGIVLDASEAKLIFFEEEKPVLKVELAPTLRALAEQDISKANIDRLTVDAKAGEYEVRVIVREANGQIEPERVGINSISALLLIK